MAGECRAVKVGGLVSCRGVAVVDGVGVWWRGVQVGVGGVVIDVCCQAAYVGSWVSRCVVLVVGVSDVGWYVGRWCGVT